MTINGPMHACMHENSSCTRHMCNVARAQADICHRCNYEKGRRHIRNVTCHILKHIHNGRRQLIIAFKAILRSLPRSPCDSTLYLSARVAPVLGVRGRVCTIRFPPLLRRFPQKKKKKSSARDYYCEVLIHSIHLAMHRGPAPTIPARQAMCSVTSKSESSPGPWRECADPRQRPSCD